MLGADELLARAGGHVVTSNNKPQRTNDSDPGKIFGLDWSGPLGPDRDAFND
jgi:hypothetical protein